MEKKSETTLLFDWINKQCVANEHFSLSNAKCRREFLSFLESNDYFGLNDIFLSNFGKKQSIKLSDAEKLCPHINLWINSYGMSHGEKLCLLINHMKSILPKTGDLFEDFVYESEASTRSTWILADYLCFSLKTELTRMSESMLNQMAEDISKELPLNSAQLFSSFLLYARTNRYLPNGYAFHFHSRIESNGVTAYTSLAFLEMAYIVFNSEAWQEEHLLEKALKSKRDATLWLFIALHFICGWRKTDLLRIPMPALPSCGQIIRDEIVSGTFSGEEFLRDIEFRLQYLPIKPNKTATHDNISNLKFFVPESLRKPLSIIFAIAISHHEDIKPGSPFIKPSGELYHLKKFFGERFFTACDGRGFSTRRANKSYLQGIETIADSTSTKAKGYMLAALARNHKGGVGSLPKSTDIYLKDANFSGYSADFIAKEMFERGVFSFIPVLLLKIHSEEDYLKISLPNQTKLLAEIGLSAYGLENMSKTVDNAIHRARYAISEIMKHPESTRGTIEEILQNIACGNAPSKQDGCMCLMIASDLACVEPARDCCIGCGYEIYTKTIFHQLISEYKRLLKLKNTAISADSKRYSKILKEAVMPAIAEMLTVMKLFCSETELLPILKTAELEVNL